MEHIIHAFEDDRPPERRVPPPPVRAPFKKLYRCAHANECGKEGMVSENPNVFCNPVEV